MRARHTEPQRRRGASGQLSWLAVLLLSLYPARFLAGSTLWPTLDGQTHTFRILALEQALVEGAWYPRWMPDLLHGYGYPLFEFYAPLLYYVALPLRMLGVSHLGALEAVTALGFAVAGLSTYALAREYLGHLGGLLAAAAYVYWPYRLAVVYVRGDVPEALALALLPLALWCFVRLAKVRTRGSIALAALTFAAVICTHNVTAALFAPVLVAVVGVLALTPGLSSVKRARGAEGGVRGSLAFAAGLGLAAFFWLPALWDTRWLHAERLYFGDYLGSLASPLALLQPVSWAYHYYPDTGNPETTFPPGFLALALTLPGAAALLRRDLDRRRRTALLFALALLVLPLAGMMRPFAPILTWVQVIQAPYRWLGLAGLGAAMLTGASALWLERLPTLARAAGALGAILLLAASATARLAPARADAPAHLGLPDLYAYEASRGSPGTTWAGEFTPRWVSADPLRFSVAASAAQTASPAALAAATVEVGPWTALDRQVRVESAEGVDLALHSAYVPGWQVAIDGRPAEIRPLGPLGLTGVHIPPGEHSVRFHFGSTAARLLATGVSALAALALMLALTPSPSPAKRERGAAGGVRAWPLRASAVASVALLAAVLAGLWPGWTPAAGGSARPARVDLGGKVELLGVSSGPGEVRPGAAVPVTLYWLALAPLPGDYKVFVHLVDADRRKLTQEDGLPVHGAGRTSAWWPGELVEDQHVLRLPADSPPGEYRLEVGLYDGQTGGRLPMRAIDAGAPVTILDGNSAMVGVVRVR